MCGRAEWAPAGVIRRSPAIDRGRIHVDSDRFESVRIAHRMVLLTGRRDKRDRREIARDLQNSRKTLSSWRSRVRARSNAAYAREPDRARAEKEPAYRGSAAPPLPFGRAGESVNARFPAAISVSSCSAPSRRAFWTRTSRWISTASVSRCACLALRVRPPSCRA